jgi:hypothetical protein
VTTEQAINLAGHVAWPVVALLGILLLRPYVAQLTRAAGDLRDLLNRSGEMVDLVSQISALNEATSDIKAAQEMARAARPDAVPVPGEANVEVLWGQLVRQWEETRDSFRSVAQSAGVPVNFIGSTKLREAANTLVERGIINQTTAASMTDLSAQFQYMFRTAPARSDYLNANVVAAYSKSAAQVRHSLKTGAV